MKRTIAILLALLMVLSLAGCGDGTSTSNTPAPTEVAENTLDPAGTETPLEPEPEAEEHKHSFGEWIVIVEPTCEETGQRERTCECGEKETESIPMTEHEFTEATLFEPKTCKVCGKTEGVALSTEVKIGDTISLDFVEMTIDEFLISDGEEFSYSQLEVFGTSTRYVSLECPAGMKLICLYGKFTNLTSQTIYPANDPAEGLVIINGDEYKTDLDCYNLNAATLKLEVVPKETVDYFYYAAVPESVADSLETCDIIIGFVEGLDPAKWISEISDYDYLYRVEVSASDNAK